MPSRQSQRCVKSAKSKGAKSVKSKTCDLGVRSRRSRRHGSSAKSKACDPGLWVRRRSRKVRSGCDSKSKSNGDLGSWRSGCDSKSNNDPGLCLSLRMIPEMVWSENFHFKPFPPQKPYFTVKLKIFSIWPNFLDLLNMLFSGKGFLNSVWSQNKQSLNIIILQCKCKRLRGSSQGSKKINFFMWMAVWGMILTNDNLMKRGITLVDWCRMCRCSKKTGSFFLDCKITYALKSCLYLRFHW